MPAQMRIDVAGIGDGIPGESRIDGTTDTLITLRSVGGGSTHRFRLLWVPFQDGLSEGTLAQTSSTVWTFTTSDYEGECYRIELIVDEGLPSESRQIRILGVPTATGVLVPPYGADSDPRATLANQGPAVISRNEMNYSDGPYPDGFPFGWYRELRSYMLGSGGGGAGPDVLWEWNRTDLTQFDPLYRYANTSGTSAGTVTALYESDAYLSGSVPGISFTSADLVGGAVLPLRLEELNRPDAYVIEVTFLTGTGGVWAQTLLAGGLDAGGTPAFQGFVAERLVDGTSHQLNRVEVGQVVVNTGGDAMGTVNAGAFDADTQAVGIKLRYEVVLKGIAEAGYRHAVNALEQGRNGIDHGASSFETTGGIDLSGLQTNEGGMAQIGIGVRRETAGEANLVVLDLRILRHPLGR